MLHTAMHAQPDDSASASDTPPPKPPPKPKRPPKRPAKPKPSAPPKPPAHTTTATHLARRRATRGTESWDSVAPDERARRLADSLWAELYALPDLGAADAKRILDLLREVDPAGVVASTLDSERAQRPDPAVLISTITHYAGLPVADLIAQGLALDERDRQLRAGVYTPPGDATAPSPSQPRESASVAHSPAHRPDGAQHSASGTADSDGATRSTADGYGAGREDGDDRVDAGGRGDTFVGTSTQVDPSVSEGSARWERAAYRSIAEAILSAMTVDAGRLAQALVEVEAEMAARAPVPADSQR